MNDIVIFREEQGGNLDSAFAALLRFFTYWRNSQNRHLVAGLVISQPVRWLHTGGTGSGGKGTITTDAGGQVTAVTLTMVARVIGAVIGSAWQLTQPSLAVLASLLKLYR